MNKLLMTTLILGVLSTTAFADAIGGREGQLSFIPKISMGKDVGELGIEENFKGINADILYSPTANLEVGVNVAWVPYSIDVDDKSTIDDYDETLNALELSGVMRYSFNQLDLLTPFVSAKAGWAFGDSKIEYKNGDVNKYEGAWIVGVAAGIEYKNVNFELGYQMTEFKNSLETTFESEKEREDLVYFSIGYRFE